MKPVNFDIDSDGFIAVAKPDNKPPRFKLLSNDELLNLPPLQWVVKDVLPASGIGAIYGASGSGKSFLALDMAQAMAAGNDWFSYPIKKPAKIVYVALEGESGISGRVKAYHAKNGTQSANIRYLLSNLDLRTLGDQVDLIAAVKASGFDGGVLIIDTLNRAAAGADENSSKDMGDIITGVKRLQADLGGLVLLVHHTGKDTAKGLRGHSSLHAALDVAIEVRRDGLSRSWINAKSKDGADGREHGFELKVVEIGEDEDGDPITSCVIEATEVSTLKPKKARLNARNAAILQTLNDAIALHGVEPTDEIKAKFSGVGKVVDIELWRPLAYKTIPIDSESKDPTQVKPRAFKRARDLLLNQSYVVEYDGFAWRIFD